MKIDYIPRKCSKFHIIFVNDFQNVLHCWIRCKFDVVFLTEVMLFHRFLNCQCHKLLTTSRKILGKRYCSMKSKHSLDCIFISSRKFQTTRKSLLVIKQRQHKVIWNYFTPHGVLDQALTLRLWCFMPKTPLEFNNLLCEQSYNPLSSFFLNCQVSSPIGGHKIITVY